MGGEPLPPIFYFDELLPPQPQSPRGKTFDRLREVTVISLNAPLVKGARTSQISSWIWPSLRLCGALVFAPGGQEITIAQR